MDMTEILQVIAAHTEQIKTLFTRSDEQHDLLESVHALAMSVKEMAMELKAMRKDVDSLRRDLDKVRDRPADNWRTIVKSAISGIVGALVGAAMLLLIK